MFDYKQRPWSRPISDEEYARAVGITNVQSPRTCKGCGACVMDDKDGLTRLYSTGALHSCGDSDIRFKSKLEHVCHLTGFGLSRTDYCPACDFIINAGFTCRWCECVVTEDGKDLFGRTECTAWVGTTTACAHEGNRAEDPIGGKWCEECGAFMMVVKHEARAR